MTGIIDFITGVFSGNWSKAWQGIVDMLGGIFGGILTNKLFLMALVKISNLNKVMKFEISYSAIIDTSCIFIAILIAVFIKEYIILLKTDITKLINATHIYQSDNSKNKTLQGLLGLMTILLAYALIIYYKNSISKIQKIFVIQNFSKIDNFLI